ncbi:MAG TPA: substrate-binding domain-containing protein [Beijerinckiaceae bacterium]|jgi:molybdate transport system substrate-binding protein
MRSIGPAALALAAALPFAAPAPAAEIKVMNSGGFTAAYKDLAPGCERATGNTVETAWGASMGNAPDAIPMRLARGEPADVLIMAAPALDQMIAEGKAVAGSRVDLAHSSIAMAVRAGAPKPDIGSVEAFRRALMEAPSIAYSASASGVYLSTEVFPRLDPSGAIMAKSRRILSERVGAVVARGEAEIGFQQLSELLPIEGIDIVGPLPAELQRVTVFSAGVAANAKEPDAARALIACLAAPEAAPAIRKSGLEPAPAR